MMHSLSRVSISSRAEPFVAQALEGKVYVRLHALEYGLLDSLGESVPCGLIRGVGAELLVVSSHPTPLWKAARRQLEAILSHPKKSYTHGA